MFNFVVKKHRNTERQFRNFTGGLWTHILSGHLSHQVEHHLYPDLPAWRYRELGPQVQEICARYGIPYQVDSLSKQLKTVAVNTVKYALPPLEKLPKWLQKGIQTAPPLLSKSIKEKAQGLPDTLKTVQQKIIQNEPSLASMFKPGSRTESIHASAA